MPISGLGPASSTTTHEPPRDISSKPNAQSGGNVLYIYAKDKSKNAVPKLHIIPIKSPTQMENESRKQVENKLSKSGSLNKSAQRVLSNIKSWAKDHLSNSSSRKAGFGGQSLVIKESSERKVSISDQNQNIESSSSSRGSVNQTAQLKSTFSLGDLKNIDDMISELENDSKKTLTTASTTTVNSTTTNTTGLEKNSKAVIKPSDQDIDELLNFIDASAKKQPTQKSAMPDTSDQDIDELLNFIDASAKKQPTQKSAMPDTSDQDIDELLNFIDASAKKQPTQKSAVPNTIDQELDSLLDDLDVLVKKQDSEKPATTVKSKAIEEFDNLFDELEQLLDKKKPEST